MEQETNQEHQYLLELDLKETFNPCYYCGKHVIPKVTVLYLTAYVEVSCCMQYLHADSYYKAKADWNKMNPVPLKQLELPLTSSCSAYSFLGIPESSPQLLLPLEFHVETIRS
jgi:hypothetical protein